MSPTPRPSDPDSSRHPASEISEERAISALRRAARLQAEASERLDEHSRALIARRPQNDGERGFGRAEVEAVAAEAGISAEYVRQALLEQDTLGEHAEDLSPRMETLGNVVLRAPRRSIEVRRRIAAEPAAVLEAMQRIFPAHPYHLTLIDSIGEGPLEGGVLVFEIPRISMMNTSRATSFSYAATSVDLLQLHVSVAPVPAGDRTHCELVVRGDLRTGIRRNVWAGLGISGVTSAFGALVGAAVGAALSGGLLPALVAGAALGGAGGGAGGAAGYGVTYRYYLKKMNRELETLLRVVDANARTGGAFRAPAPGARKDDTDDLDMVISSM